jgi:hypothetical protein
MRCTGGIMGNPGFEGGGGDRYKVGDLIPIHRELGAGGNAIPYHMQDPWVREYFEAKCKEDGAESTMPKEVYTAAGASIQVMED